MPLFKVSLESKVAVSAVVVSKAATKQEAIAEARFLQSRARVNWSRGQTKIGAIEAPYEVWAHPRPEGGFTVSMFAYIPVSVFQSVVAEDAETVRNSVMESQAAGLIEWKYRGIPIGEYREPIATYWANRQPDVETEVSLSLSADSVYPGQSVVMSADVTGPETPVGSIEFVDVTPGGLGSIVLTALEPDAVNAGLSHARTVVTLPAGNYQIVGRYPGSDGFQPSQSGPATLTISKLETSIAVTPPAPPVYAGQSILLNVVVGHDNPTAPKPTGNVSLFQGTTIISTVQLGPDGSADFNLGTMNPGDYSFDVQYDGDAIHEVSSTAVPEITVQQATTTTALASLESASDDALTNPVFSQDVRLRAVVTSVVPGTVPVGTVTFADGVTPLGMVSLSPLSSNSSMAELVIDSLQVGSHSVTAEYGGNASFAPSASSPVAMTVGPATTVVNASTLTNPTKFGQLAEFEATVDVLPPAKKTPFQVHGESASVRFTRSSGTLLAEVPFDDQGRAVYSKSDLEVGQTVIVVSFEATPEFTAASTIITQSVEKSDVQVEVTFNPNPAPSLAVVQTTAKVTPVAPGSGVPTGTVAFSVYDPYWYGNLFLGSASILNGEGSINYQNLLIVTSYYDVTCQYSGDEHFNPATVTAQIMAYGQFG